MVQAAIAPHFTPEAYLAFERGARVRHEYAAGELFAMAGGTLEHSAIAANLLRDLGVMLYRRPCRVLTSDMRIKIPSSERYLYPDGAVVCGAPEFEDDRRDTLLNPRLVIEVLSDSSEAYDRGDKFAQYRQLPSVQAYLLASQKEPRLEVFEMQADGSWVMRIYGPGTTATITPVGCGLTVDRIYAGVFDADAEAAGADTTGEHAAGAEAAGAEAAGAE